MSDDPTVRVSVAHPEVAEGVEPRAPSCWTCSMAVDQYECASTRPTNDWCETWIDETTGDPIPGAPICPGWIPVNKPQRGEESR